MGVDIDFDPTFDSHIKNICKNRSATQCTKENRQKSTQIKQNEHFPYIYIVKFQFLSTVNVFLLQNIVKERALRFVCDDYNSSFMELLTKANLPTMETHRMRTMALETFKILNGLALPVLSDLLVKGGQM